MTSPTTDPGRRSPEPRTIRRILVPLDGSRLAEAALPSAEALAQSLPARVTLLHVLEQGAPTTIHGHDHLNDPHRAEQYLHQVAREFHGIPNVEIHVHPNPEGDVAASIAAHAAEFEADLIVLCAHGEGNAKGWMSGTIAQQVIRRATPPVLLIRPEGSGAARPFAPDGVLIALDGHAHGEAALAPSLALAKALHLPVRLVVAVPTLGSLGSRLASSALFVPSAASAALDMEEEAAVSYLRDLCGALSQEGYVTRGEVLRGDPAKMVSGAAGRSPQGMVALATHGTAGFDAFWSESVGAKLIGRVQGPLLLVHP
jgi:nucleotide-binding universal stress UspA family protein